MAVSPAVRQYYAKHIFAMSGRDKAPPNFTPLDRPHTGMSSVEGCRGGGKNVLEVTLVGEGDAIADIRMSCGLCNPAMYAAADVVCEWARGKDFDAMLYPSQKHAFDAPSAWVDEYRRIERLFDRVLKG